MQQDKNGRAQRRQLICPTSNQLRDLGRVSRLSPPDSAQNHVRANTGFVRQFKLLRLSLHRDENFTSVFQKYVICLAPSRLDKRDVRVVTNVRQDAMDVILAARRAAWTRTAKACGPGAPRLALSARGDDLAGDGDKVMDTGESSKHAVKPLRREGRMSRRTCGD